ncbi:MAG TPA: glycoside hydrolase, partial [Runella sp.]|nr:glycoside hydrolase [Runella sp.]
MNLKNTLGILLSSAAFFFQAEAQQRYVSKVWVSDLGNGTYKNPVIDADYSDPDACRVGNDFYMVASSFDAIPGLPILHSNDLVNWKLIGHALKRQPPFDHFSKTQHGNGVWAPAIRYHKGEFYIYYPDPDFGIYLTKAKNPTGPWSAPLLVEGGKGLIDPCPFWDEDGQAYLAHGWAGSRAGIKSILTIKKMNPEGTAVLDEGIIVYDGHEKDPTIEGPKLYKRNGYYYLFAPAGGVATGWQLVLRSKNVYGPYERKVVMAQGNTAINGPHQGAWVDTPTGEDWFLHFQDKGVYGRVVHLQPMKWVNNWPVIGIDNDGDGNGDPVLSYKKPNVGKTYPIETPVESDEFDSIQLGLQWQWQA